VLRNGDSIADVDLKGLIGAHLRRKSLATMTLVLAEQAERYGSVSVDEEENVLSFAEKQAAGSAPPGDAPHYINGGVYVFQREVLSRIPPAPPAVSLERFVLPRLAGNSLRGFRSNGYFIDVGVPEDFLRAQDELPTRLGYVHAHTRPPGAQREAVREMLSLLRRTGCGLEGISVKELIHKGHCLESDAESSSQRPRKHHYR
jgi:NDP-sugar pyrophosphorylase family protein